MLVEDILGLESEESEKSAANGGRDNRGVRSQIKP